MKISYRITMVQISSKIGTRGHAKQQVHYYTDEKAARLAFITFVPPNRKGTFKITLEKITHPEIMDTKEFKGIPTTK